MIARGRNGHFKAKFLSICTSGKYLFTLELRSKVIGERPPLMIEGTAEDLEILRGLINGAIDTCKEEKVLTLTAEV
jgi:hypothetical protein